MKTTKLQFEYNKKANLKNKKKSNTNLNESLSEITLF